MNYKLCRSFYRQRLAFVFSHREPELAHSNQLSEYQVVRQLENWTVIESNREVFVYVCLRLDFCTRSTRFSGKIQQLTSSRRCKKSHPLMMPPCPRVKQRPVSTLSAGTEKPQKLLCSNFTELISSCLRLWTYHQALYMCDKREAAEDDFYKWKM